MSASPFHDLSLLLRFSAATLLVSIACGIIAASLLAPLNEPFWGWGYYVREWIGVAAYSTPLIYFIVSIGFLGIVWMTRSRSRAAVHIFAGLYREWWLLAVTLLWATARFIAAPVTDANFGFVDGSAHSLQHLTLIAVAMSGVAGSAVFVAAIGVLVVRTLRRERRQVRRRRGLCPACAYPVGTSPVCTECGSPLLRASEGEGLGVRVPESLRPVKEPAHPAFDNPHPGPLPSKGEGINP